MIESATSLNHSPISMTTSEEPEWESKVAKFAAMSSIKP